VVALLLVLVLEQQLTHQEAQELQTQAVAVVEQMVPIQPITAALVVLELLF
jgi:hypothetical protein